MRDFGASWSLLVLIAALAGCNQNEEIRVYRVATEGSGQSKPGMPDDPHAGLQPGALPGELPPGHPTTSAANSVTGDQPEEWEAGRLSSMRKASFLAKGADGEMADISLVILAGNAGGVLDNVNRWREQLGLPALDASGLEEVTERLATKAGEAVVVDLEGLAAGADPKVDGRTVAAIVEGPAETWFFKMRGNAELVSAQKKGFLDWVASAQLDEKGNAAAAPPAGGVDPNASLPEGHPQIPAGVAPPAERGPIKWQVPAGWTEGPPKTMRLVTFLVTGPGDAGGEVTVVKLAGEGGGALANLNRWREQIGLAPVGADELAGMIEPYRVGDLEMSKVDQAGPKGATVAAWINHEGHRWFFKLTGPAAVVEAQRENFASFLKSVEFVNE